MLHKAAKRITHLTRRRHTKRNDLITRKRATHRNRSIHRQLIKTIRAQKRRHTSRHTVTVARQQLATLQLSTSMANISTRCRRLKPLRHIQVMNARLSLQMGTHARTRRTLRTLIQAGMLLPHQRPRPPPEQRSGGPQQRVAIVRALLARPEVVFADEPTGNLDSNSGAEVLRLLRAAATDHAQTILMVTHDANAASYADRVVFIKDGMVAGEMIDPTYDAVLGAMAQLEGR